MTFFSLFTAICILMCLMFFMCAVVLIPLALVNLFGPYGLLAAIMVVAIMFVAFYIF